MNKLLEWLTEEIKGTGNIINFIFFASFLALAWNTCVVILFSLAGIKLFDGAINYSEPTVAFLMILGLCSILEEIIFRYMPLKIGTAIFKQSRAVIFIAIVISAIFGYLHGNWVNVPLQGATGFAFSCIYLKCGGFQKRRLKALAASSCAHILFNFTIEFLAFL